jgi:hypothetical protein
MLLLSPLKGVDPFFVSLTSCKKPAPRSILNHLYKQDFSTGYMFGQLFYSFNLQPDFEQFEPKRTPDGMINNFSRLQVWCTAPVSPSKPTNHLPALPAAHIHTPGHHHEHKDSQLAHA